MIVPDCDIVGGQDTLSFSNAALAATRLSSDVHVYRNILGGSITVVTVAGFDEVDALAEVPNTWEPLGDRICQMQQASDRT